VADAFRCTIVTPDEAIFDEDVTYVSMPSWDGQQGVMSGQSPLLTRLGIGSLRIDRNGSDALVYWVDGGFARADGSTLTILTEHAVLPQDLSATEAEKELAAANTHAIEGGHTSAEDRRRAEDAQARARTKRAMAQS
jgi:F-type H+-transporting ATPase subunit epsilon